jgi:hypothetical protein
VLVIGPKAVSDSMITAADANANQVVKIAIGYAFDI